MHPQGRDEWDLKLKMIRNSKLLLVLTAWTASRALYEA
jgi:hypothetical protein